MALAFIPENEVEEQFDACITGLSADHLNILQDFISYFRDTWVNGLFCRRMWNKYGLDHLHRTNNRVESWHSTLKKKLPIHPNIFVFINALKVIESGGQLVLLRVDAGEEPPRRRVKYVQLEEAIQKSHASHVSGEINTTNLLKRVRHFTRKFK